MPYVIDAPIDQPAFRVSSVHTTRSFYRCRSTPVPHSPRPWGRWLRTLGRQTESAMDRLAREKPYQYIQTPWG